MQATTVTTKCISPSDTRRRKVSVTSTSGRRRKSRLLTPESLEKLTLSYYRGRQMSDSLADSLAAFRKHRHSRELASRRVSAVLQEEQVCVCPIYDLVCGDFLAWFCLYLISISRFPNVVVTYIFLCNFIQGNA